MKIRFQADADLRFPIVKGAKRRKPVIDFQTANEANTMPENFTHFIEAQASPGVVLIPQEMPYHDAIERLIRLWTTTEAETWQNVLFFLPH